MNDSPFRPGVLIICNRKPVRDTIRVLVGTMGYRWLLASGLEDALATLDRESLSAAILDWPCASSSPEAIDPSLREILLRLPGRVLVLMDETSGSAINELVKTYGLPVVHNDRLAQDLLGSLETVFFPAKTHRFTEAASLVMDTFLQPLPVGIRGSQAHSRHLLYESAFLSVDLLFEPLSDRSRTSLVGQVMRTSSPELPLHGVPVLLRGQEGALASTVTNQSGEFSLEFPSEPHVTMEVEDQPNHCVSFVSPSLAWVASSLRPGGASPRRSPGPTRKPVPAKGKKK